MISLGLNTIYFLASLWFFDLMFTQSKKSGQFARNES